MASGEQPPRSGRLQHWSGIGEAHDGEVEAARVRRTSASWRQLYLDFNCYVLEDVAVAGDDGIRLSALVWWRRAAVHRVRWGGERRRLGFCDWWRGCFGARGV